jgi:hypothetical protein
MPQPERMRPGPGNWVPPHGPHLAAALICETVLREQDGVMSLIRVIDRITLTPDKDAPDEMPPLNIAVKAVVQLKSDRAKGKHTLSLRLQKPNGQYLETVNVPVFFEGEDRGYNVITDIKLTADFEGLYWIDVAIDGTVITRMPLRIVYAKAATGMLGLPEDPVPPTS